VVPASQAKPKLYLLALGSELSSEDVTYVRRALQSFYDFDVLILPSMELPRDAWYAPRSRYRAEILLEHLARRMPADGFRILGLTRSDISTTKGNVRDWGILGLATIDGSACVISSFRTMKGVQGAQQARVRLGKVAVHEIGHTLGLRHCPHLGCLMEDAQGTVATTDRERELCPECRAELLRRGIALIGAPSPPWD